MQQSVESLDLRGTPCPLNFVKTKLRLEQLPPETLLEVWLDAGEPMEQVPDSLRMNDYQVERIEERDGFFALQVWRLARVDAVDAMDGSGVQPEC